MRQSKSRWYPFVCVVFLHSPARRIVEAEVEEARLAAELERVKAEEARANLDMEVDMKLCTALQLPCIACAVRALIASCVGCVLYSGAR